MTYSGAGCKFGRGEPLKPRVLTSGIVIEASGFEGTMAGGLTRAEK